MEYGVLFGRSYYLDNEIRHRRPRIYLSEYLQNSKFIFEGIIKTMPIFQDLFMSVLMYNLWKILVNSVFNHILTISYENFHKYGKISSYLR